MTGKDVQAARKIAARIRAGMVSPAEITELQLLYEEAQREISESRA